MMAQRIRLIYQRLPYPFGGNPLPEIQDFSITLTGLFLDDLGAYGELGQHQEIGYTISPDNGTHTVKWSGSVNPADSATFGTGANPTDFSIRDGLLVYLHVTDRGFTKTLSFPIRRASGAFSVLPLLQFDEDDGVQTYQFPSATGTGLSWVYSLLSAPEGVTLDEPIRTLSFDTDALNTELYIYTLAAEDQYGRRIINDSLFQILPIPLPLATVVNDSIFWEEDVAITPYDITSLFELNGNTGTFEASALPAGLSEVSDEITGTPTTEGTGNIIVTFTDSYGREVQATLSYEIAATPAPVDIFSNFSWDEDQGILIFDCNVAGTYTWNFGAANGTFTIVAGANNPSIDLTAYSGNTEEFTITKDGQELYVDANFTIP